MNARLLQRLLNLEGFGLAVDGKLGPVTRRAFDSLPLPKRQLIELEASSAISGDMVSGAVVRPLVTAVAAETGVPASYLELTLSHEFEPCLGDKFVAVPNSGKYIGIGQFDQPTWKGVMPGRPYSDALDPKLAIEAIAKYYVRNKAYFKKYPSIPFTDKVAYLAHNRGARGAYAVISGTQEVGDGQSDRALALARELRRLYGPQNRRFS